jgi:hypothetical protein
MFDVPARTQNPYNVKPNELRPNDRLGFKIIAVIGSGHDWAAYQGLSSWSDEQVATEGDKISQAAAEALFYAPVAAGLSYRH